MGGAVPLHELNPSRNTAMFQVEKHEWLNMGMSASQAS